MCKSAQKGPRRNCQACLQADKMWCVQTMELDHPAWLDFVSSRETALPYHHPAWARLLAECYGYPAFAAVQTGPDGRIRAGLPCLEVKAPSGGRRWVSLRYTDIFPPLTTAGGVDARLVADLNAMRTSAGVTAVEVRDAVRGPGA